MFESQRKIHRNINIWYIEKMVALSKYEKPKKLQYSPYQPPPLKCGKRSHSTIPEDSINTANEDRVEVIQ